MKRKKIFNYTLNILLGITAALVLYAIISIMFFNRDNAFLFGYKPYIISSESMEPSYLKYSLVLIKNDGYDDVKAGDPIAFRTKELGGNSVFHRVVEITDEGFITKGDNNIIKDGLTVNRDNYIGRKIFHTNITAWLVFLAQSPGNFLLFVVMPTLFVISIIIFIKTFKKANRRNPE